MRVDLKAQSSHRLDLYVCERERQSQRHRETGTERNIETGIEMEIRECSVGEKQVKADIKVGNSILKTLKYNKIGGLIESMSKNVCI